MRLAVQDQVPASVAFSIGRFAAQPAVAVGIPIAQDHWLVVAEDPMGEKVTVVLGRGLLEEVASEVAIGHAAAQGAIHVHFQILAHHRATADLIERLGQMHVAEAADEHLIDHRTLPFDVGVTRHLRLTKDLRASGDHRTIAHSGLTSDLGPVADDGPTANDGVISNHGTVHHHGVVFDACPPHHLGAIAHLRLNADESAGIDRRTLGYPAVAIAVAATVVFCDRRQDGRRLRGRGAASEGDLIGGAPFLVEADAKSKWDVGIRRGSDRQHPFAILWAQVERAAAAAPHAAVTRATGAIDRHQRCAPSRVLTVLRQALEIGTDALRASGWREIDQVVAVLTRRMGLPGCVGERPVVDRLQQRTVPGRGLLRPTHPLQAVLHDMIPRRVVCRQFTNHVAEVLDAVAAEHAVLNRAAHDHLEGIFERTTAIVTAVALPYHIGEGLGESRAFAEVL